MENYLKIGYMSGEELSEWFGLSYGSFRNQKSAKIEELKEYADFEERRNRIYIKYIYKPVYVKKRSSNYMIVRNNLDKEWGNLNTGKRVAENIYKKHKEDLTISESTTYFYTLMSRKELFGTPFGETGSKGSCFYIFAKEDEKGRYVPLTVQEKEIKDELIRKYFGTFGEKVVFVENMVAEGEIRKEEFYDKLKEITGLSGLYVMFKAELELKIGAKIVKATQINRVTEDAAAWQEEILKYMG